MADELDEKRQRMSAYAVVINDDHMLLARIAPGYPRAGEWTLPGGGLHWGEDPRDAVHRELFEEAGLRGEIIGLLGIDSLRIRRTYNGQRVGYHALRVIYEMAAQGEPRVTEVDGSVSESRWVSLAELANLPAVELVESGLRMLAENSAP